MNHRRRGVAWREGALAGFWALLLGIVFSGVHIATDYGETHREEAATVSQLLHSLRDPAAQAAYNLSESTAEVVVDGLLVYAPVHEARLIDDFGGRLAERARAGAVRGDGEWWSRWAQPTREYRLPLVFGRDAKPVGRLEVIVDQSYRIESFLAGAKRVVLLGLARNLVLAAVLVIAFHLTLTRPLVALAQAIRDREGRSTSQPIAVTSQAARVDEIAEIARAFDRYAEGAAQREKTIARTAAALEASETRYRRVVETAHEGVWAIDEHGITTLANEALAGMLRTTSAELVGRSVFEFMDEAGRQEAVRDLDRRRQGVAERHQFRFLRADGDELWAELATTPIIDASGAFRGALAMVADIGERRQQDAALRDANAALARTVAHLERHQRALELMAAMNMRLQAAPSEFDAYDAIARAGKAMFAPHQGSVSLVDAAGNLVPAAQWGSEGGFGDWVPAANCPAARRGETQAAMECACARVHPVAGGPRHGACIPLLVDGSLVGILQLACDPEAAREMPDLDGHARLFAEMLKLGLANLRLREALREQAIRDPLTGIANRRLLDEVLPREIARCIRSGGHLVVAMIDIDHFKDFNDNHGHAAGDVVLRLVANLLVREVRGGDLACRYGGEEFVCLMNAMSVEEANDRFDAVRQRIAQQSPWHLGHSLGRITVSIGLAGIPTHAHSAEEALHAADAAMYLAKEAGRNCVRVAVPVAAVEADAAEHALR